MSHLEQRKGSELWRMCVDNAGLRTEVTVYIGAAASAYRKLALDPQPAWILYMAEG